MILILLGKIFPRSNNWQLKILNYVNTTLKKIYVFDLDDTLVLTEARVKIYHTEDFSLVHSFTPIEFNSYEKKANHLLDFDDFDCFETLSKGKLITQNLKILRRAYELGYDIAIVTARSNKPAVVQFLLEKKIPVDSSLVYAVSDPSFNYDGSVAERKSQAFIDLYKKGYRDFVYYDDNLENLEKVKETLQKKHAKISTFQV